MKTTSLAKIERQIALPLHGHATGIALDPKMRISRDVSTRFGRT